MQRDTMRLGILGLGRIGTHHARELLALGGADRPVVEQLVVAGGRPGSADRAAAALGNRVRAVDSPADVLAAGLDGVVVAAPTADHPRLVAAAVAAGLPVLVEKPLAASVAEARALVEEIGGSAVPVSVGFQRRFDAGYSAARAAVGSGELGFVHTVRASTLDPAPPPAGYLAGSGGIFRDCGVHDLDAVRWVLGQEVVHVFATGSSRSDALAGTSVFADAGDVDTAAAVLTFADGTLGVVSNTRFNGRGYDCRLEVLGSADSIAAGLDDRTPLRSVEPGVTFPAGSPWDFFIDRFTDAYAAQLAQFTEVVAGRAEPVCPPADALETARLADACTRSLREGRPVLLTEVPA